MSGHAAAAPPLAYGIFWGLPFVGLLLTIGVMPLLLPGLWHRHYGKIAAAWALAFLLPAAAFVGPGHTLADFLETAVHEYLPFIMLLGALFTVTGGLRVTGAPRGSPAVNTALLALGTVVAGLVGTVGAALLLLRPLLRANRHRRQVTHVFVFYIFLVANIGGALTPIGNPPLLLGYLKGVPFFWPTRHLALPTLVLAAGLLLVFYALDRYLDRRRGSEPEVLPEIEKLGIEGRINLALLLAAVATVLLRLLWDPAVGLHVLGVEWRLEEIVDDGLLLLLSLLSLRLTPAAVRQANAFAWAPMAEVAILFAAIFVTLIPVTAMLAAGAAGPLKPLTTQLLAQGVPNDPLFYLLTGGLSAVLDNAPTYLLFFGLAGGDAGTLTGPLATTLTAISAGACYFGGLTYIGSAPNLMVKAIVESQGVRMPSFFAYSGWALVCLLPWLLLVEVIFLR